MTVSRSLGLAGIAALAGLTGVSAQAFYGGDQTGVCSDFTDFADLGCFDGDIRAARQYNFIPQNYVPGTDPSSVFPGFWPGTVFNNTVTPGACAEACRGFGFGIAALYDGECSCGYLPPPSGTPGGTCDLACTGDADQTCGGADATQVFGDPSFADPQQLLDVPQSQLAAGYQFLGCFNVPSSQGFPTQNRANSAGTASTAQVCQERCATLGYPLAYSSFLSSTSVNCECGETFASGNYRVDETTEDACLSACDDDTVGGCDLTAGICCGSGDYQAVYINPELEGCFVPVIPGYGQIDPDTAAVTGYACADVPASLVGGPTSLTRRQEVTATLDPYGPEPTHPFSVDGTAGQFFEYGCVTGTAADIFVDDNGVGTYTAITVLPATTIDGCALACEDSPYFAVTGGATCYCATAIQDGLTFEDFGLCNTRCEGSATQLCGGTNTLEIYAQADYWDSTAALQLRLVALESPIPSVPCTTGGTIGTGTGTALPTATGTGTGTGTGTVQPTATGTGTGTGLPTGTGTGAPTGTGAETGTGTGVPTGTGAETGTGTGVPTGTGAETGTGTGVPTGTGAETGTGSGVPTGTGAETGTGTGVPTGTGAETGTGTGVPTGTGAETGTGTGAPTGTETGTGTGAPTGTGAETGTGTGVPTGTGSQTGTGTGAPTGTGAETGAPTGTGTATGSPSSSGSVIPSQPPSVNRYIFGVNLLDGEGDETFAKRSIKSVNSGFIGNAGPGRVATQKRQDGFVGGAGPLNPTDCTLATPFQFIDGTLVSGDELVSTDPGIAYQPFYTNPVASAITTEFSIGNNILLWGNAAFTDFYTEFCQDTAGQVWIIFNGEAPPFECPLVELVVYSVTECSPDGNIISVAPTGTATGTGAIPTDVPTGTGTGIVSGTATGTGAATDSATVTGGASTGAGESVTSGASSASSAPPSSVVDNTLTIGDHTYAFPATITPGDYGCFTENATWVQGETRPTLFVGAV